MVEIREAENEHDVKLVAELFREYERWIDMDLCFQSFEEELASLPGKYSPPDGRLFVAFVNETPVGCIALRKLEEGICEMKRLYLNESARGLGIGRSLIEKLITVAREIGYKRMRLDTFPPKMGKAVSLYEAYGFRPIPSYYDNPHDGVLYMELELDQSASVSIS
ncbi:GNAT family N-acetyltransferase [Leptolyngbya sp. 7M]|uniref:GNAT family N-acetyltransferase n=1 Tax=Leptolyngbya sp. 7M TaxID=2812896 RepID=UPI001B8BA358|nr:GNAT family N-acetyltransferase [Leptolyngbya sp. 7M]QYO67841.1 GNAT family N-acetyltransferase [Leptolyngbya sp. 7M]